MVFFPFVQAGMEGPDDDSLNLSPGHLQHLEELSSHELGDMDDFFGTYGEAETDAVVEVVSKAIKRKPEGQEAESHPVKRPCPNEAAEAVAQEAAQFI